MDGISQTTDERVLVMAPFGQDAPVMSTLLEHEGFRSLPCAGPAECAAQIATGAGALVLTEEALQLPQIAGLWRILEDQPPWSELPVIILTNGGEPRVRMLLDMTAAAARTATLLERPISTATLIRSVQVAMNSRRRQYQVRELLQRLERLAAERAQQSRTFDSLASALSDYLCVFDRDARFVFANKPLLDLWGLKSDEAIGRTMHELAYDAGVEKTLRDAIGHVFETGESVTNETCYTSPAGVPGDYENILTPVLGADGDVVLVAGSSRDITARKRAEMNLRAAKEQAEAASQAKDHFLAALSHELRTPLTPVLMTASALREDESLSDDIRGQLGMIERNVALEARLIDDLLDLTRITQGKLSLRAEPSDAHSLIGLVVETVREEAREKGVGIALELQAERHHLQGDPTRLQQVFWNLLRNAVKFTPAGGNVCIRSNNARSAAGANARPSICVEIKDSGIGLPPGAAERIFEPFEQVIPRPDHRSSGLGLGLAIARTIVDLHHGVIRAESPGLGMGATFAVELPGAQLAPAAFASRTGTGDPKSPDALDRDPPMRLLVVEDHEPTLQVLTRLLTRAGHHVVSAGSAAAARSFAETHSFDAVISDLGLPDGTGLELMEDLRARHSLRGVALSGYGMDEDLQRSRRAGFEAHLVKPVNVHELRRALRQIVQPVPEAGCKSR